MSEQHQQRQQELLQRIAKLASPDPSLITAEGAQQMLQESCIRQQALSTAEAIRAKVGDAPGLGQPQLLTLLLLLTSSAHGLNQVSHSTEGDVAVCRSATRLCWQHGSSSCRG
jgi:hypothetical protein